NKITYVSNYLVNELEEIKQLVDIADIFEAYIEVLHFYDNEFTSLSEKEYMNIFSAKVKERINYDKISFGLIPSENIEKKLETYIREKKTDLLVLSNRKRGPLKSMI